MLPKTPQPAPKRATKNCGLSQGLAEIACGRGGAAYRTRTCDPIITKARVASEKSVILQLFGPDGLQ